MKKSMLFEAVAILLLLFLLFVLYVMVTTGGPCPGPGQWTLFGLTVSTARGPTMFMGPSDELYLINGEYLNAVSPGGKVLWKVKIPDDLGLLRQSWWVSQKAFDDDIICLLLFPDELRVPLGQELVVLTTNGKLLWSKPLTDTLPTGQMNNAVSVKDRRIYLHTFSNLTAYDRRGVPLWQLSNIYYQTPVGDDGTLYVAPGQYAITKVEAYSPDGVMKWSYNLENDSFPGHNIWENQAELAFSGHTVFVEQGNSLVALNEDGSLR